MVEMFVFSPCLNSLFLTTCFCHFILSEYHGFFGLVTIVLDIVGVCLLSASFSVVSYRSTILFTFFHL